MKKYTIVFIALFVALRSYSAGQKSSLGEFTSFDKYLSNMPYRSNPQASAASAAQQEQEKIEEEIISQFEQYTPELDSLKKNDDEIERLASRLKQYTPELKLEGNELVSYVQTTVYGFIDCLYMFVGYYGSRISPDTYATVAKKIKATAQGIVGLMEKVDLNPSIRNLFHHLFRNIIYNKDIMAALISSPELKLKMEKILKKYPTFEPSPNDLDFKSIANRFPRYRPFYDATRELTLTPFQEIGENRYAKELHEMFKRGRFKTLLLVLATPTLKAKL